MKTKDERTPPESSKSISPFRWSQDIAPDSPPRLLCGTLPRTLPAESAQENSKEESSKPILLTGSSGPLDPRPNDSEHTDKNSEINP